MYCREIGKIVIIIKICSVCVGDHSSRSSLLFSSPVGSDLVFKSQRKTGPLFSKYGQNDLVNIYKLQYHDSQFLSTAFEFR